MPTALPGRQLVDKLYELCTPNEELHYRDAEQRLLGAGYMARGAEPYRTLLTALGRHEGFEQRGKRSGLYRCLQEKRAAPPGSPNSPRSSESNHPVQPEIESTKPARREAERLAQQIHFTEGTPVAKARDIAYRRLRIT